MTEDEAKRTRCCGSVGCGTNNNGQTARFCIASDCMAWRVQVTEAYQENAYNRPVAPEGAGWKPHSPNKTNTGWWRQIPAVRAGYCGLAGQP